MKARINPTTQKLLNLYRQYHVILGGWGAINPVFLSDATPEILTELKDLPTGSLLVQHIKNLQSGKTPIDSIETELLPYSGLMKNQSQSTKLSDADMHELTLALKNFNPGAKDLTKIKSLSVVKKFGPEWENGIKASLQADNSLSEKWDSVLKTNRAYNLWDTAQHIVSEPITERVRAQIQAELPDYETYLPMFGDAGNELLKKLRSFLGAA